MNKVFWMALLAAMVTTSCSKEMLKKHKASFDVNGVRVIGDENTVGASFNIGNYNELVVDMLASDGSNHQVMLVLDLAKVGQTVVFDTVPTQSFYSKDNTATRYYPVAGEWKITGRNEGDNNDKYTEGTFSFVGVNPVNTTDTVRITNGSFYVNKYN
ncbi:MAG: hypothetical protein IPH78_08765 [Bacteroidetes bacterium]|nr:hypothetical protein [Bacteroidota bacterium]